MAIKIFSVDQVTMTDPSLSGKNHGLKYGPKLFGYRENQQNWFASPKTGLIRFLWFTENQFGTIKKSNLKN
jgi:hypothetical protein